MEQLLEKVAGVFVVAMDVAGIGSVCVGGALLDSVWRSIPLYCRLIYASGCRSGLGGRSHGSSRSVYQRLWSGVA